MKIWIKYLAIGLFTLVLAQQADAQKFGYLNSKALLAEMPEVKQANSNLEALQKQLQKRGQQMLTTLQTNYQDLQRKEQQGELSPKQLEEEAKLLKQKEEELGKFEQDMQKQLLEKENQLLQPILEKVNQAIRAVAQENGYTYIFDASLGFILYADEASDVTNLVKAKLGF